MGIQVTWGRAGQSGSLYDFDVCQGGQNTDKEKSDVGATGDAVLKMTSTLPAGKNHKVFADNFFTKGRGSLDFRVNQEDNIIVRWFDNKAVNLLSSFVGIEPLGNAKHWARKAKTYIMVPRPAIVDTYNRFMGGVDLPDMLSSLYKFSFRSRRLVQLHLVAHHYSGTNQCMDPLQKRPGEPAAQAETPAPAKVSGCCWHCPHQKQRQPLPGRGNPQRCPLV